MWWCIAIISAIQEVEIGDSQVLRPAWAKLARSYLRNKTQNQDVGKKEPSYTVVGMQASTTTLEKNLEVS
jgi:hypothetical protein